MSSYALILILASTVMHATWNLILRGQNAKHAFFCRVYLVMAVVGAVPIGALELTHHYLTPTAWWCLIGSAVSLALYSTSMLNSYTHADFTIAYPIMRALPVLLIAIADVLRGKQITVAAWLGMFLVAAGCLLAPLHRFGDFHPRRYFRWASLWMLMTALGTVGYSFCDKIAAETLEQAPGPAAVYCYFFFLLGGMAFCLTMRSLGKHRDEGSSKIGWGKVVIVAVFNYVSYWMIVRVYQMVANASYVVAFRQLSIIIGVVAAFIIFRERGLAVRLTGSLLITAGLVLIALLGG